MSDTGPGGTGGPGAPRQVLVGGRYELGELLGRGGMAEVRKGTDTRLGRIVAVKRLRTDLASDATFQARFRREAQSSASLNHPSIVAVYDTGEEPAADVSQPYIVMEFVAGRTLREILREGRKILPERALEITSGVLSALDYSHRAGIIHRDIKPGNVMLTPTGDVKVMDFGIARAMSDAANSMTQTAAVVGTAQYLSPEQARGETVDSRSDVYSAGCLLYELLTGRPPFVGDSPVAVAYQHVREQAQPPSEHDTDLTPEIDAIVMKALAKRLEDRYQSAGAMRTDIERYLAGRPVEAGPPPVAAPPPVPAPVPVPPERPEPAPLPVADDDERPARTGLWILLGLLVIALLVAGWFLVKDSLFPESPEEVQVPTLTGLTEDEARVEIGDAGLEVGDVTARNDDVVPAGRVLEQDPGAEDFVDPDTVVDLVVSAGKPQVEVPSVVGLARRDAKQQLDSARGFRVTARVQDTDDDAERGDRPEPAGRHPGRRRVAGHDHLLRRARGGAGRHRARPTGGRAQDRPRRASRSSSATTRRPPSPRGTVTDQIPGEGDASRPGRRRHALRLRSTSSPPPRRRPPRRRRHRLRPPRGSRHRPAATLRPGGSADRRRGADVEQAVVGGRLEGVLGVELPPDGDVGLVGVLPEALHVGVGVERGHERQRVADGLDRVRLRVRHALQLDGVALALDARRGDHALALDGHRLGAADPQRVHHGLDVLLVHDERPQVGVGVGERLLEHLARGVGEHDGDPRSARGLETRGVAHPVGTAPDPLGGAVVDVAAQPVDLGLEVAGAVLQPLVAGGVGAHQGREVGVATGPQVGALAVDEAHHEQPAAQEQCSAGAEAPAAARGVRVAPSHAD